jgi:hypothetical protein
VHEANPKRGIHLPVFSERIQGYEPVDTSPALSSTGSNLRH